MFTNLRSDCRVSEIAYTEPFPMTSTPAGQSADEDHGRTSEEEEGVTEPSFERQIDGRSRAFYVAQELLDSERLHVSALKLLQEDFRAAVGGAVGEGEEPVLGEESRGESLGVLPQVYNLHKSLLQELEQRISLWEQSPRMVDVFLSHGEDFRVFDTYISEYDRSMFLLDESRRNSPAFSDIVSAFEGEGGGGGGGGGGVSREGLKRPEGLGGPRGPGGGPL
uniref:DH domain-containing protein n=1 Tax=Knipowitschia caucasica TaxID=637954 RepID=A0AAV2K014_KNICA